MGRLDSELATYLATNIEGLEAEEERKERARQEEARRQEEIRTWCGSYMEKAASIFRTKGRVAHEDQGISRSTGEKITHYWWETDYVPVENESDSVRVGMRSYPRNRGLFPIIESISIVSALEERGTERALFEVTRTKATRWDGHEVSPEERPSLEGILDALEEKLPPHPMPKGHALGCA